MYSFDKKSRIFLKSSEDVTYATTSGRYHHNSSGFDDTNLDSDCIDQASQSHTYVVPESKRRLSYGSSYRHPDHITHLFDNTPKIKTHASRDRRESEEFYKSALERAGLTTVKTRRIIRKTTTITRGHREKVGLLEECIPSCYYNVFALNNLHILFLIL